MSGQIQFKQLSRLLWDLKALDTVFCDYIIKNANNLWIHFNENSFYLQENEGIISMQNIKIKNLDRANKVLYLFQPIIHEGISFDKIDLSNFSKFKDLMDQQKKVVQYYIHWNERDTMDFGFDKDRAWDVLV